MRASSPQGPEILVPTFSEVVEKSGAHGGLLMLLSPSEPTLHATLLSGVPVKFAGPWARIWLEADFALAQAARERRQIWVAPNERSTSYPEPAAAAPYPFAAIDTPLLSGDTLWGTLGVMWPSSHPPEPVPGELAVVNAGARRLSALLSRCAEEGRPVRPHREALFVPRREGSRYGGEEALAGARFAERLPGGSLTLSLEGEVTFLTEAAAKLLGAPAGDLLGSLPWDVLPWLRDPVYEDGLRRALFTRQPTSFTVLRPPDVCLSFALFPDVSGISVRLQRTAEPVEDRAVGASTLTAEAEAEVSALASPGYDEAPTRVGSLYHAMHLAVVLTQAVEVRDILDIVYHPVMSAFEADGVALITVEGDRLRILGHRGLTEESLRLLVGHPLDATPAPAARSVRDQEALFFTGPEEMDGALSGWSARGGMSACALMPLTASGRPIGCVAFCYQEPHRFGSGHRTLLTSVSGLLAQALDRALLYDAQHQLARRLQAGLLPAVLPHVPGLHVAARYESATRGVDIGGDFYDLIRLDDGCAVTIGDVQGHNMEAAALMGQVRTAVHATAGARPDEVLARTNRLLTDLDAELFVSCLYVQVDFAAHRALLATAGHPPPLLLDADGRVTLLTVPPGPLLGVEPTAPYTSTEIPLPPGSALLCYTDGLVETPGVDLDASLAELADQLRRVAAETPDVIVDTLLRQAHRSGTRSDDMALLLVQRGTAATTSTAHAAGRG
ncbi:SpoIIE family protein phosphatase [Streptomyces sp. B6B3]|uniref:SpoIIE family protein phosphatase n=1 Tax=Streptomyces sp. B6B3 TaxID=3153570 RepID=UPI00325E189E